jgi:ribosomal-protein-alanine N-acetyltransferase
VRNIAVRSDCRKKGIASILIAHMITDTSKKGARWATLEVRRSNIGAIGLYEKFGFILTGVRPLYYRDTKEDALIMWMDLAKEPRDAG